MIGKIGKITMAIGVLTTIIAISVTPSAHAFKLTKTSYEDGYNNAISDAYNDYHGLNGHGYDDSCPRGHTEIYCQGYIDGYNVTWNSESSRLNGVTNIQPQPQPLPPLVPSESQSQGRSQEQKQGTDINIHVGQSQSQSEAQSQAQR
jgi:hypothetical protein